MDQQTSVLWKCEDVPLRLKVWGWKPWLLLEACVMRCQASELRALQFISCHVLAEEECLDIGRPRSRRVPSLAEHGNFGVLRKFLKKKPKPGYFDPSGQVWRRKLHEKWDQAGSIQNWLLSIPFLQQLQCHVPLPISLRLSTPRSPEPFEYSCACEFSGIAFCVPQKVLGNVCTVRVWSAGECRRSSEVG